MRHYRWVELAPIPENGVLVHTGLPKTGSTSLQGVLYGKRQQVADLGVLLQSPETWYRGAVMDGRPERQQALRSLQRAVRGHSGRVFITNELLCDASAEQAEQLVRGFGRPTKVLTMVRSFPDLLPSVWQQRVKGGQEIPPSYEEWLRSAIDDASRSSAGFWLRHDLDRVFDAWARAVGEENLVFVVVDRSEPNRSSAAIEQLLGLPAGMLAGTAKGRSKNRSWPYATVEMVRQIQLGSGLDKIQRRQLMKMAKRRMAKEGWVGDPIPIPQWAVDGIRPHAQSFVDLLAGSRATVLGDPAVLCEPTRTPTPHLEPPGEVPMATAVAATTASLKYVQRARKQQRVAPAESQTRPPWYRRVFTVGRA